MVLSQFSFCGFKSTFSVRQKKLKMLNFVPNISKVTRRDFCLTGELLKEYWYKNHTTKYYMVRWVLRFWVITFWGWDRGTTPDSSNVFLERVGVRIQICRIHGGSTVEEPNFKDVHRFGSPNISVHSKGMHLVELKIIIYTLKYHSNRAVRTLHTVIGTGAAYSCRASEHLLVTILRLRDLDDSWPESNLGVPLHKSGIITAILSGLRQIPNFPTTHPNPTSQVKYSGTSFIIIFLRSISTKVQAIANVKATSLTNGYF